ncbi:MAG: transposase [Enterocloster sp.]
MDTAKDIQGYLKDLLGGTIKEMMEAEMDEHLGYEESERSLTMTIIAAGISASEVNGRYGSVAVEVPQDRKSTFEPQVVKSVKKI